MSWENDSAYSPGGGHKLTQGPSGTWEQSVTEGGYPSFENILKGLVPGGIVAPAEEREHEWNEEFQDYYNPHLMNPKLREGYEKGRK